ncbi:OmpA family protein [Thalassomonas viridans]|uniref:OmpA family protein n=1 Tax=Thalassomonas viridans TaxID=137584 RepID=A0AAE9Z4N0_9GAMM|nr:OmpA family protein [Thalassomonas viridans]WDE05183.1 OmpA family protein [Thalassomonas viridans]
MNKHFKLSSVAITVGLLLAPQLQAAAQANTRTTGQQENCNQQCSLTPESGRTEHNSQVSNSMPGENSERVLVRKHFILHQLPNTEASQSHELVKESGSVAVTQDTSIRFYSGKHFITDKTRTEIQQVIDQLKGKQALKIHFIGHADSQRLSANARKVYRDNQDLSEHRADIVAGIFKQELGLTNEQITTEGKADREPVASNATLAGMAKNRRVEVIASYEQSREILTDNKPEFNREDICHGQLEAVEGLRITVDGKPLQPDASLSNADQQRCADIALEKADIQLQYDNLSALPRLNINHALVKTDQGLELVAQGYSNYLYFIEKAELLIFDDSSQTPLTAIGLDKSLKGRWLIPQELTGENFSYRLKVYDPRGTFDQTIKLPLKVSEELVIAQEALQPHLLAGYGESTLGKQNIAISGGSLTLNGSKVPANHKVYFLGRELPLSKQQGFVHQQILPSAVHSAEVAILDEKGNGQLIRRDLELAKNSWFYVGLADITLGKNSSDGPVELLTGDDHHYDGDLFVDGRLAFYSKGKWRDRYKVTASVDSREQPLNELFSNFAAKDPNSLFRRLEQENHYAVYGDDSTLVEDAPTKGKFYLKVADQYSHAMWGNFHTKFDDTELTRIERGLYGGQLAWNSSEFTSFGQQQSQIDLFAAEADTSAAYEQHRGTGGSLYYLQHQDITQGSERVSIEIRDKNSDLVLTRIPLSPGSDYDIDSLQGRILLTKPLPSTSDDGLLIRDGGISGHPTYLVVNYEYVPGFDELDDLALGGRASHWLNDSVKLGFTASSQEVSGEKQKLLGLDLTYRHSDNSYLKLEAARSDGLALSAQTSANGGYNFNPIEGGNSLVKADAYRVESALAFSDLGLSSRGLGQFYWQQKEAGYHGLRQITRYDTDQIGANLSWGFSEDTNLRLKLDNREEDGGIDQLTAELNLVQRLDEQWQLSLGIRSDDTNADNPNSEPDNPGRTGQRTDVVLQLDYDAQNTWSAFIFAQGTAEHDNSRNANNRVGLGGAYQLTDKLNLSGEISDGNLGFGSQIGSEYQYSENSNVYLNYQLDPDRSDNGLSGRNGQLVSGARHRFSDSTSVYGEERYQHGNRTGLVHAYGIDYTPDDRWTLGLAMENGRIREKEQAEVERDAIAFNGGYATPAFKYAGALEYRQDKTDVEKRNSWLVRNNFNYKVNPDWRAQLRLDMAFSDSSNGDNLNSDFTEALLGFAYRPVTNDRLNALLTYNFLSDLAPSEQFTASGRQQDYQQRSHVFALDANYDISQRWTLGGKFASRTGEIRQGRETGQWFDSTAELYIVRADWHVVKNWDFLVEGRMLKVSEAKDKRSGALISLHRHLGDNLKLGIGFNFTEFSDDLTDLDYDAKGWFINLVGKI